MPENDTRITQIIFGVALGFGGLVLLGMIGLIVLYFNADALLEGRGNALRENLAEIHANLIRDGKIPEEHRELIDDLVARGADPGSGVVAPWMVTGMVIHSLDDGELSTDELSLVEETIAFLTANPSPNPITVGTYLDQHPELQATVERVQQEQR